MKTTFCTFIGLIFSLALVLPAQGQNVLADPTAYVDSAYSLAMQGHLQEAVALNYEALENIPEDSVATRCEFYSCLLYCYHRLGDYEQALHYGELCLLYDEEHGTKEDLSVSLGNLAGIYSSAGKQDVAIDYLRRSIDIETALLASDTTHTAVSLAIRKAMLGEVLVAKAKSAFSQSPEGEKTAGGGLNANGLSLLDEALHLTDDALQIERLLGRRTQEGIRLAQLANIYDALGQKERAKECNREALEIARETGNRPSELIILLQDGQLQEAIVLAQELGMRKQEYEACDRLYRQAQAAGRSGEALAWLEKARVLHEQMQSEETQRQLTIAQVRYDSYRKEQQLKAQQRAIQEERSRARMLLMLSALSLIIVLLLVLLLVQLRRRKRMVEEAAAYKERQYIILTHDLTNPMVAQQQVLRMFYRDFSNYTPEQIRALTGQLLAGSDSQLSLLRNLGEMAQLEQGKRTMQPTRLDLGSLITDSIVLMRSIADLKDVTISLKSERMLVTADREALRTILRNIISNAIKFSPKGGVVEVGTKAPSSFYVHNDGEYLPQEKIDEIMHAKTRVESRVGTSGESGTGVGLLLCRELVAMNHGTMQILSAPNEGVTMVINVPR